MQYIGFNFMMIAECFDSVEEMLTSKGKEVQKGTLNGLAGYAYYHFTAEEWEMLNHKYHALTKKILLEWFTVLQFH